MRRKLALAGLALAWLAPIAGTSAAPTTSLHLHSGHGLQLTSSRQVDAREINATVLTAALGKPVNVRVLLPVGYAAHPQRRYPTLYLYAGTGENASSWTNYGNIEGLTAHRSLIVVMPDIGFGIADGWWSNWLNRKTSLGPNQWETFQLIELIPWIDENFRTWGTRAGRAVAGLSQGGFGAMVAAARHPDLFASAASLSGAVDIAYGNVAQQVIWHGFVVGTALADFVPPFSVFGSPLRHEVNWQGHDPTTLVRNLRGMDVHLYTGNGLPGPYDTPQSIPLASIEVLAHAQTHTMYDHARQLGVPLKLTDYGAGTHSFPYWIHDLRTYLPEIMRIFARHVAAPAHVSYEATAPRWSQWGWTVEDRRPVAEQFTYLRHAGSDGFTLLGQGRAAVTTPAFYPDGFVVTAAIHSGGHTRRVSLTPDHSGRVRMRVTLPASVRLTAYRAVVVDPT